MEVAVNKCLPVYLQFFGDFGVAVAGEVNQVALRCHCEVDQLLGTAWSFGDAGECVLTG